jgi:hypothetical protein
VAGAQQRFGVDAELLEGPGPGGLDHDVGRLEQAAQIVAAAGGGEVDNVASAQRACNVMLDGTLERSNVSASSTALCKSVLAVRAGCWAEKVRMRRTSSEARAAAVAIACNDP